MCICLEIMYSWQTILVPFVLRNDISNILPLPNDSALIVLQFLIQTIKYIIQQLYFAHKVHLMFYFKFSTISPLPQHKQ